MSSLGMDGPSPLDPRGLDDLARAWESIDLAMIRSSFPTVEQEGKDRDTILKSIKEYVLGEAHRGMVLLGSRPPHHIRAWEGRVRGDLLRPVQLNGDTPPLQTSEKVTSVAEVDTLIRAAGPDRFLSLLNLRDQSGRSVLPTHGGYKTLPEGEFAALFVEGSNKMATPNEFFYSWSICTSPSVLRKLIGRATNCCQSGSGSASESSLIYMAKYAIYSKVQVPPQDVDDLQFKTFESLGEKPRGIYCDSHAYDFKTRVSLRSGLELGVFRLQFQQNRHNRVQVSALPTVEN